MGFNKFTSKRALIWLLFIVFLLCSHGISDFKDAVIYTGPADGIDISYSFPFSFEIGGLTVSFKILVCALFSFIASFLVVTLLTRSNMKDLNDYFDGKTTISDIQHNMDKLAELEDFVKMLEEQSGLRGVFYSGTRSLNSGNYYKDVKKEILSTHSIKLLSIAGYEYFGKKAKSLLYAACVDHPEIAIELTILHPHQCHEFLEQRSKELRCRDEKYTMQNIVEDIQSTIDVAEKLHYDRKDLNAGEVNCFLTTTPPAFRILIFDQCLYFNTYVAGLHGHETPVFKVLNQPNDFATGRFSLYESMLKYYEQIKNGSTNHFDQCDLQNG